MTAGFKARAGAQVLMRGVLLVLLLAPAAAAAPVDVHVFFDAFAGQLSTQDPPEDAVMESGRGVLVLGCEGPAPLDLRFEGWVDTTRQDGRYHYAPLGYGPRDVPLRLNEAPLLEWHVTAQGLVPRFVLEARLVASQWHGDTPDDATLLAEARVGPIDLVPGEAPAGGTYQERDGQHVYGFRLGLPLDAFESPAWTLQVQAFQEPPACNLSPASLRHVSLPGARSVLRLDVREALWIAEAEVVVDEDWIAVGANVDSALGYADLPAPWGGKGECAHDDHPFEAVIIGPDGTVAAEVRKRAEVHPGGAGYWEGPASTSCFHEHAPFTAHASWLFEPDRPLPPGAYQIHISASNRDGRFTDAQVVRFDTSAGAQEACERQADGWHCEARAGPVMVAAPGLVAGPLAMLAVLAVLARCRGNR